MCGCGEGAGVFVNVTGMLCYSGHLVESRPCPDVNEIWMDVRHITTRTTGREDIHLMISFSGEGCGGTEFVVGVVVEFPPTIVQHHVLLVPHCFSSCFC